MEEAGTRVTSALKREMSASDHRVLVVRVMDFEYRQPADEDEPSVEDERRAELLGIPEFELGELLQLRLVRKGVIVDDGTRADISSFDREELVEQILDLERNLRVHGEAQEFFERVSGGSAADTTAVPAGLSDGPEAALVEEHAAPPEPIPVDVDAGSETPTSEPAAAAEPQAVEALPAEEVEDVPPPGFFPPSMPPEPLVSADVAGDAGDEQEDSMRTDERRRHLLDVLADPILCTELAHFVSVILDELAPTAVMRAAQRLESEFCDSKESARGLRKRIDELDGTMASLGERLGAARDELAKLRERTTSERSQHAKRLRGHDARLDGLSEVSRRNSRDVTNAGRALDVHDFRFEDMARDISRLLDAQVKNRDDYGDLRRRVVALETRLAESDSCSTRELEDIRQQLSDLRAEGQAREDRLNERIDALHDFMRQGLRALDEVIP
jgi:hypothetical protein